MFPAIARIGRPMTSLEILLACLAVIATIAAVLIVVSAAGGNPLAFTAT